MTDDVVISVSLHCRGKGRGRGYTKGEREQGGGDTEWGVLGENTCSNTQSPTTGTLIRVSKASGQLHFNPHDYLPKEQKQQPWSNDSHKLICTVAKSVHVTNDLVRSSENSTILTTRAKVPLALRATQGRLNVAAVPTPSADPLVVPPAPPASVVTITTGGAEAICDAVTV